MMGESQAFLVMGNWKMHGTLAQAQSLVSGLDAHVRAHAYVLGDAVDVALCPPATLVHSAVQWLDASSSRIGIGGQDCHTHTHGAYTGDVSAQQLRDAGAQWVLVGHSERRQYYGETDALVCAKARAALDAGLKPVICVGETLEQREAGQAMAVVRSQILASIPTHDGHVYVAYEPVWAIGTGKIPTLEDIETIHLGIINVLRTEQAIDVDRLTVLYGGSVKATNARVIRHVSGVGGMLVGGARLDVAEFSAIIDAAVE